MKNKINILIFSFLIAVSVYSQTLEDYLKEATKNSPELQAQAFATKIAEEKVFEVGSLPNTKFNTGIFVQEPETRVGAQKVKLGVQQQFPWFGTLNAKKDGAKYMAAASEDEFNLAKRNLFLNVKKSYYKLYELKFKIHILTQNIHILQLYEQLVLSKLETGKGTMVDVLRVQIKQNDLENKIATINTNLTTEKQIFNRLLNKEPSSLIAIPDTLTIHKTLPTKNLSIDLHPQLSKLGHITKSLELNEMAAKRSGLPKIGLGLDYVFVQERLDASPIDNGKDIIMPMVSLSMPLFSKKYSSKRNQFKLQQQMVAKQKENQVNQLSSKLDKAVANYKNAFNSHKTAQKNSIETKRAIDLSLKTYETGKVDFTTLLELQAMELLFQINEIESLKKALVAKAMIVYLTE